MSHQSLNALQVIRGFNGWYVFDKNGLYAGPFKIAADAYALTTPKESRDAA